MNVLVIGATGYVGGAIARALKGDGHTVTGTARNADAAKKLADAGLRSVEADVTAPASVASAAREADAVVYAVSYTGDDAAEVEPAALHALVDALAGTNKTLLYISGVWLYGTANGAVADERTPANPTPLVARRPAMERIVLDGVARNVRAIVVRPGVLYGQPGPSDIPSMWVQSARNDGAATYVGDGSAHVAAIHGDDLAALVTLALVKAPAGAIYNATDDTAFTVKELAEAASVGAGKNGATRAWPLEEARNTLGAFADALALDLRATSAKARNELGWEPKAPNLFDELRSGIYTR